MSGALSLLAGVLVGLTSAQLPHSVWLQAAIVLVAVVLLTPLRVAVVPRRLALLLGGMALAWLPVARWTALHVPARAADERVLLEGHILTVPARDGGEFTFDARVRMVSDADRRPRLARLRWRIQEPPRVGERWRLLVRLARADTVVNFHGVDPARLAFRDGIHLHGRILPSALNTRLMLAHDSIDTLRARIATRIAQRIADPDAAGLVTALAVGLTDGMSTDQWRVFNATGTTHLVAISGLHVTLFATLAFALARLLWRGLPARLGVEREPFALLSGLLAAGGYALLAGFSVPTQRTWLMLAVFALARLASRPVSAARTWSLAMMAVLLLDPLAPLAAGFWLSFVAVGVILVLETTSLKTSSRVRFVELQFAVMLALAPLTFAVFGGISLVGLAVNLLAIPIISFVLVPVVLAGVLAAWSMPALDGIAFGAAAKLYEWLWPGMVWAADLEHATWRFEPPPWWFAMAVPAALLLMRRWPWGLRLGAAAVSLPLLLAPSRLPPAGSVQVQVFDAARGTAVLIATRSHAVLFDTGDSWNTHGTMAPRVIMPALDALGIHRVDLLILPRLDADRAAGAALLALERDVGQILVGGGWPATSLPASACRDSERRWDGVRLQLFSAGKAGGHCVLRISAGGWSMLLPGDMDVNAERDLLSRLPDGELGSDFVLLSRQASSRGSALEWIEASRAVTAIATGGIAGSEARAQTLARWRHAGVHVLDTRALGGIQFAFGTPGVAAFEAARPARYPFAWRRVE